MRVLYSFSLVEMEILDLHMWLSRFYIAARVMELRRKISGDFELLSGQGSQDRQTLQPLQPPALEM